MRHKAYFCRKQHEEGPDNHFNNKASRLDIRSMRQYAQNWQSREPFVCRGELNNAVGQEE
jgi:hypothetical protein